MRAVLIDTGERNSKRFEDLCERLDMDNNEAQRLEVFGCLMTWWLKWAGDKATDTGLLWDVTEKRMGVWSGWVRKKPEVFGRALVRAGYAERVEDVFPPGVLQDRGGFVVRGALEDAWNNHKHRGDAAELVLCMTNPVKRAEWAVKLAGEGKLRVEPERFPGGWLPEETFKGGIKETAVDPPPPLQPPLDVDVQTNEEKEIQRQRRGSNVIAMPVNNSPGPAVYADVDGADGPRRRKPTGKPKSSAMLEGIRALRYDNPLAALTLTDDGDEARKLWIEAVTICTSDVMQILSEMTETDECWLQIGSPAAVATSRLLPIVQAERRRRRGDRRIRGL